MKGRPLAQCARGRNCLGGSVNIKCLAAVTLIAAAFGSAALADAPAPAYRLQSGDILAVSVWKEPDLVSEVTIRPDGRLSFPLAGDLVAATRSVEELRGELEERLKKYIPDVLVTVIVKAVTGNRVYVLGKVARPGDFVLNRPTDVMQALGLAGGTTPFDDTNAIRILRREGASQTAIPFRYGEVEHGRHLEQNILLRSGDPVVVP